MSKSLWKPQMITQQQKCWRGSTWISTIPVPWSKLQTVIDEMNTSAGIVSMSNYTINFPQSMSIDLTNKFGDIYINEVSGKARINLSYGSLDVNKLNNSDNLIDLKFCNSAKVRSIQGAVVNLKYSTLDIDYAGSLRLDSKYSKPECK